MTDDGVNIDEELLLITSYDSVLDDTLFARARSTSTARQLVFDADGVSLQVVAKYMASTPGSATGELNTDSTNWRSSGVAPSSRSNMDSN